MKKSFIFLLIILLSIPVLGQEKKMRTRLLASLTNIEIEEYLSRNDVIIVPIGPIEVNGANPVDVEYVGPLAYAMKIAEKVDALVLEHMVFCYPGGTTTGKASIYVSPTDYTKFIKIIATSLLRQGFKTQIYITAHGPSHSFMDAFLFEFLAETKVPVLHLSMGTIESKLTLTTKTDRGATMLGSYSIVGRLNDVALTADLEGISQPNLASYVPKLPMPPEGIRSRQVNDSYPTAWFYNSPYDHGGVPKAIATNAAERERLAKIGVAYINEVVDKMDAPKIVQAIKDHQKYIQDVVKKYGDQLPN
jgi:creatinine amidohydrolase